ncbi:MAG TPA: lysylphosphatidylglycerol synthase transmembrane domain-containing protein [Candidatus Nanoarchaeia archaeon]|nr:lysylphosphatidylglycerol synthase transmembrane domain-containing protein [Candidatus Nanoarchaeia archaeon]
MKINIRKFLPLLGILIFIYVIYHVGFDKLAKTLPTVQWNYVLLSVILALIIIVVQAWKWDLILHRQQIYLPFSYILKVHLISSFYGNITPGRIGTFSKIFYLKEKTKKDIGACISSVTLERFFDLFTVAFFAFLGSIMALKYFNGIFLQSLILFLVLIVILLLSLHEPTRNFFIWRVFYFLVPRRFKDRARSSFEAFHATLLRPQQVIVPIIVTILTWFGLYLQMYLIALALNINVPILPFIFISSIATIVTLIPITIGGIGTSELAITVLFNKVFAVDPAVALSLALINRVIGLIGTVIGGILSMREEKYF